METTSFILGVCAVIIIIMVVGTLVNYMTIKSLKRDVTDNLRHMDLIQMDMEKKEREFWSNINNIDRNRIDEQEKIYRLIDSRVDKTLDKLSEHISEVYRELERLENNKESIKGGKRLLVD